MIIFTLTNTKTQQVYVGATKDCANERWKQYQAALAFGIKAPLYNDMREHGAENFVLNECGFAYDMEEAREIMNETIDDLEAISLQGMKTSATAVLSAVKAKPRAKTSTINKSKKTTTPISINEKPKIATGRTGSSAKEKNIREAIAKETADREEKRYRQIAAEADEMKAIMARLDARGSTTAKR